jgi:hypothetical protein
VDSLRIQSSPYGQYRYNQRGTKPLLYASVFAALFRHLVGDLEQLTEEERQQWINYINSYQCEDGLFRDSLIANDIAETEDWWGWRHLTFHALMSLNALGGRPKFFLNFLEIVNTPEKVKQWIHRLDWNERASFTSNTVQNYCVCMQYSRDFLHESSLQDCINELLAGVSEYCNTKTGLWGRGIDNPVVALSEGVQAGYHFWLLYWYDKLPIPYPDKAVQSIINLQNPLGGFDLTRFYSSACQDIDSLHPLIQLGIQYPQFKEQAIVTVRKSLPWILSNFNHDGGACFLKESPFEYGHQLMFSQISESSIFATWFRMLALSYSYEILKDYINWIQVYKFNYLTCPGLQFPLFYSHS